MLSSSGELTRNERTLVLEHLSTCGFCASRLQEVKVFQDEMRELHRIRLASVSAPNHSISFVESSVRPTWIRWTAITLFCSVLIVFGAFGDEYVVSAHATTLLERASTAEAKQFEIPQTYQVNSNGDTCYLSRTMHQDQREGASCARTESLLSGAGWSTTHPLSAAAFEKWRQSLKYHRDFVVSKRSGWEVRTESISGLLKSATLRLSSPSYNPIALKLEFKNETLLIEPTEARPATILDTKTAGTHKAIGSRPDTISNPLNPLDVSQADAWQALHKANADTGWEATVTRQGSTIVVKGVVADEERRSQLMDSLKSINALHAEIGTYSTASPLMQAALPVRIQQGAGEPLAQAWLKTRFPKADERSNFENDLREESRYLLGRAHVLDDLEQSLRDVRACDQCKASLLALKDAQQATIHAELLELATAVAPNFGETPNVAENLSYSDAQRLDAALCDLFFGTSGEDVSAREDQAEIREFLFKMR